MTTPKTAAQKKGTTKPKPKMNAAKAAGMRQKFAIEYCEDFNGTQAAIRAGYSAKTAKSQAHDLLRRDDVAKMIADEKKARLQRLRIDKDYVLLRHYAIDQMDLADIFDDTMTSLLPLSEWPPVWRQYLSGIDVLEQFEGYGDERELIGHLKKLKWPDKLKNLELLGKHVDVAAYDNKVNHNHSFANLTLAELLQTVKDDG